MDQHPDTAPDPQPADPDVEGHSLLIEAQGREMQDRRYRAAGDQQLAREARSRKPSHPSRLRRLLGG
jgi:hypothetical protein